MTAQTLALRILRQVGITQFTAQATGSLADSYSTADGSDVVLAINGGRQELQAKSPRYLTHKTIGLITAAPASVTLTCTANSKTISAASPSGSFIAGSTILIAGDSTYNQLDSTTALVIPYNGSSGSKTATVYNDALALPSNVSQINPPVWLNQIRQLTQAATMAELLQFDYLYSVGNNYGMNQYGYYPTGYRPRTISQPLSYMVESYSDGTSAALSYRMRLVPIPDAVYSISAEGRIAPAAITLTDLGSDSSDPGTTFDLPNGWDELFLLPMALKRFTASPLFKNESVKAEIDRQYQTAIMGLRLMNPQGVSAQRIAHGCF